MRILITGASGQLGCELKEVFKAEQLMLADMPEFDVTKAGVEERVAAARPDVIIHAAAYTDVDGAEQDPERTMALNADGTERVAKAAAKTGARFVYLSTDYVFDGRKSTPYLETDEPNPLNAYGRSKLEGERRALMSCPNTLVVRTAWLYGAHGKNFVKTIMKLALEQQELRIVADQRGCPTYARDLALVIKQMLRTDLKGIVHAVGAGDCTWYEFACEIVSLMGSPARVHPITTAESKRKARRPSYAVLANTVLAKNGIDLPNWKDALGRFMRAARVAAPA
ncbi:MAG: dTDP-4-dehydrorhamnose reductase [Nitrospiraceae bacterium]